MLPLIREHHERAFRGGRRRIRLDDGALNCCFTEMIAWKSQATLGPLGDQDDVQNYLARLFIGF